MRDLSPHVNREWGVIVLFALTVPQSALEGSPTASWTFDDGDARVVVEQASGSKDGITGYASRVVGVRGSALKFDGFTTRVTHNAPVDIQHGFSVQAWIAPQEYSWNWTGIVDQEKDHREGGSFGINHIGQVGLGLAIDGKWRTALSAGSISRLKWSHIVATYDPRGVMVLYINGQPVEEGELFRVGHRRRLEGTGLIVWMEIESQKPVTLSIEPQ